MKEKKCKKTCCNKKSLNMLKIKIPLSEKEAEALEKLPDDLLGKIMTATLFNVGFAIERYDGIQTEILVKNKKD